MRLLRLIAILSAVGILFSLLDRGYAQADDADLLVDGVPLPANVSPLAQGSSPFAGTWIGVWDGELKTILVVEAVDADGNASVVYAVADNPGRFERTWLRLKGEVDGDTLTVFNQGFAIRFMLSPTGRLRAVLGDGFGFAVLMRLDLESLTNPETAIAWTTGTSEFLATDLVEDGAPVRLEAVVFRPPGDGPFPLAVVSHGSTGTGTDPGIAKFTWTNPWFADVLNEKSWIVAFPQRRGRGRSEGVYDEGFSEDRGKGYSCDPSRSLAGADRALGDLHAAIGALRERPDVSDAPVLLAGASRGGVLSIAYAGRHPDETLGAINFVGGWVGSLCRTAETINHALFADGAAFKGATLWLYGKDDLYYPIAHSRKNFDLFRDDGGTGEFVEVTVAGKNNGHWVMAIPPLWSAVVDAFLDTLPMPDQ